MSPKSVEAGGVEVEAPTEIQDHTHYAGRGVAGVKKPITLAKNGIRQVSQSHFVNPSYDSIWHLTAFSPPLKRFALSRQERRKKFYP